MKNGAYIYKNEACEKKMHAFYDKSLTLLQVPYTEEYFETSFGRTHCLLVGDEKKPRICTIHGGNGITTLNLKLFLPLLSEYSILTPDVIGMPGKSEPHRNISSRKDEYGIWIKEVLDHYHIEKISFAVSSYSASIILSLAGYHPEMIGRSLLLVPSGIAHGPYLPMLAKMIFPFMKYYFAPSEKTMDDVIETLGGESDDVWREFFDLMMGSYKMELKGPKEYGKSELAGLDTPLLLIASRTDIFFPADKVFRRAKEILRGPLKMVEIEGKHLPTQSAMEGICRQTIEFLKMESDT